MLAEGRENDGQVCIGRLAPGVGTNLLNGCLPVGSKQRSPQECHTPLCAGPQGDLLGLVHGGAVGGRGAGGNRVCAEPNFFGPMLLGFNDGAYDKAITARLALSIAGSRT